MSYIFLWISRPSKLPKFPGYDHVWRSSNHLSNNAKLSAGVLSPKKKKTNSLGILYSLFLSAEDTTHPRTRPNQTRTVMKFLPPPAPQAFHIYEKVLYRLPEEKGNHQPHPGRNPASHNNEWPGKACHCCDNGMNVFRSRERMNRFKPFGCEGLVSIDYYHLPTYCHSNKNITDILGMGRVCFSFM